MFKRLILVVTTAALLTSAISCSKKEGGSTTSSTENTFFRELDSDPATLNPITSTDLMSRYIFDYTMQTLLNANPDTMEWEPGLAEKWDISKDGKTFTFTLRDGLKFSDGSPLTSEDVKYSFHDVLFEKGRFDAPEKRVYFEAVKEIKTPDPRTIQFVMKEVYFKNLEVLGGAYAHIIPKKYYSEGDPKDSKFSLTHVGSGPYMVDEWTKGQRIVLKKNPHWYGYSDPEIASKSFLFDRIVYRVVKEEAVKMEVFKKGDVDYLWRVQPEPFVTQTEGPDWGKRLLKVQAENRSSVNFNFGFIGWNQAKPMFKDKKVRQALAHLINREFMIEKFRFNLSEPAVGPFGNKSPASSPNVKAIPFDPKKALSLLEEAGWKMGEKGLTKKIDGKDTVFEFTLLTANPDFEKYGTVIKEDMKKVGITMNLKLLEWNSFMKAADERNFEALNMAWSVGSLESDPKQIWHSSQIAGTGNNFIAYKNAEVDRLIETLRKEMDKPKRTQIYNRLHEVIAEDAPYAFLFNNKYQLYVVNSRINRPKDTFVFDIGAEYWKAGGAQPAAH